MSQDHTNGEPTEGVQKSTGPATQRLASLDAFRGLTIVGMLIVNNVALDTATPKHLQHADWGGNVNLADLVFPWFLFIVGVSLSYAYSAHLKKGNTARSFALRALNRAAILVLLGCLVDSSVAKTPILGLGVLQIIGLAYLAGAWIYLLVPWGRVALAAFLLIGHWSAIRFYPVPGFGAGSFTAEQNFIAHVNQTYLQTFHLNGLLSVIPTAAMVIIGSLVGDVLRGGAGRGRKAWILIAAGLALVGLGLAWSLDLPFSKPLWTSSYIVYTAGLAALTLVALYIPVDIWGWKAWAFPLVVFGSNPITAYVVPILVKVMVLREWMWTAHSGSRLSLQDALQNWCYVHVGRVGGGWMYTICYVLVWWIVLWWMYRKKVFLKI
ncbi:MAG: heparan-alpha-glucosaminide N-acetyltransferase domain-containing protein [Armatimonadota bacterium]